MNKATGEDILSDIRKKAPIINNIVTGGMLNCLSEEAINRDLSSSIHAWYYEFGITHDQLWFLTVYARHYALMTVQNDFVKMDNKREGLEKAFLDLCEDQERSDVVRRLEITKNEIKLSLRNVDPDDDEWQCLVTDIIMDIELKINEIKNR